MKRQEYIITIQAPQTKVWEILWGAESYSKWTAVFDPNSRAETDWKEGSKVVFLGTGQNGMVSKIVTNNAPHYMAIEHLGILVEGKEDLDSEHGQAWAGAREDYTLKTLNEATHLTVEIDIAEAHIDSFNKTFPKALQKVKELAEL